MSLPSPTDLSDAPAGELRHAYGDDVHLVDNLFLRSALKKLSTAQTRLPQTLELLRSVYGAIFAAAAEEFPRCESQVSTRMAADHPEAAVLSGEVFDPNANFVVCDLLRAGLVPSQLIFERLLSVLPDERVRLDHLNLSRISDTKGRVTGVDLAGSKIGGSVEGATLIIPDPMGATGSTLVRAIEHYRKHHGKPRRVVVLPMICTPEFLRRVLDSVEDVVIYAARLDRGLSPADVLETSPGTHWERERGLNERSYIVPGAGGMGEVLNNSWC
ncbi:MAG: uracil phosphoribosyltransferase [bacterium]|jgi:uracil phosphoribosyltransferase|nr:uracil phosphoribosyltransferase [Planctomycetota bacterium]